MGPFEVLQSFELFEEPRFRHVGEHGNAAQSLHFATGTPITRTAVRHPRETYVRIAHHAEYRAADIVHLTLRM